MSARIVNELSLDVWDSFVFEHPLGNIFHTSEMFEVWTRTKGYRPKLWAAESSQGILALLIPVQISLMGGPLRCFTTRAVSFGNFLYSSRGDGKNAVRELIHAYTQSEKDTPLFTELRNVSDMKDIQPVLQANGFTFKDHLNYLIDLGLSKEAIWKGFGQTIRKHIRTAQKKNLEILDVTDQRKIPVIYDLLKKTYKRIRIPLPSPTFFEAAFDIMIPRGILKAYLIQGDGISISTRLVLAYKDRIIDWYTASDRSYQNFFPEEFAIWNILQWGKDHGYRIFDFGGAGRPDENYGPRIFKAKFGGTLVNFGRSTYMHHPVLLMICKIGYTSLRRFL